MPDQFAGAGRKRPLLDISVERLHLDPENPRLPEEVQGRGESEILKELYAEFNLKELMISLAQNGYLDEEPLVGIPKNLPEKFVNMDQIRLQGNDEYISFINDSKTHFVVVEGNRRLASVRILLYNDIRRELKIKWSPQLSDSLKDDISVLPVVVYPTRDTIVPYLGIRHIAGIEKWDSYPKARYIASLIEKRGMSLDDVQKTVGDTSAAVRKFYACYKLAQRMEEESEGSAENAKENFSLLILALGQGPIKNYLGLPSKWNEVNFNVIVPESKVENMKNLFSFIFGEGKEKDPVIKESRDITNYLTHVLKKEEAIKHLSLTRNLQDAFALSEGEKIHLLENLRHATTKIRLSLGYIGKHRKDKEVLEEIKNLKHQMEQMEKLLKD